MVFLFLRTCSVLLVQFARNLYALPGVHNRSRPVLRAATGDSLFESMSPHGAFPGPWDPVPKGDVVHGPSRQPVKRLNNPSRRVRLLAGLVLAPGGLTKCAPIREGDAGGSVTLTQPGSLPPGKNLFSGSHQISIAIKIDMVKRSCLWKFD